MIVVDSSVVVAILRRVHAPTWIDVIDRTSKAFMSIVSFIETSMVIYGGALMPRLATSLCCSDHWASILFRSRWSKASLPLQRFLLGKRHRAALNLADCFSYALAKVHNAPLLFQGE